MSALALLLDKSETDDGGSGKLTVPPATSLLSHLSSIESEGTMSRFTLEDGGGSRLTTIEGEGEVTEDVYGFAEQYGDMAIKFGVTVLELKMFRQLFDRHDRDASGEIDMDELLAVLAAIGKFPNNRAEAMKLAQTVKQVDKDGSGALNFEEFVDIFCNFYRLTDIMGGQQLEIAVRLTKFTPEEVAELKNVFVQYGPSGYLTVSDVRSILRMMGATISNDDVKTLSQMMKLLVVTELDGFDAIEFPAFLILIGEVINSNFCGILTSAANIVKKDYEEEAQKRRDRLSPRYVGNNEHCEE